MTTQTSKRSVKQTTPPVNPGRTVKAPSERPHPADEEDLAWAFNQALAELEPPSTFDGLVQKLQVGPGPQGARPNEVDGHVAFAAVRLGRIVRALDAIGEEQAEVLRRCYSARIPEWIDQIAGKAAPLVADALGLRVEHARIGGPEPFGEWAAGVCRRVGAGVGSARDVAVWRAAVGEAQRVLLRASRAYSSARRYQQQRRRHHG